MLSDLVSGARSLSKNGSSNKQGTTPPAIARTMASFEGEVSITADIATNSLILVATPRDYLTLKNVIEKLDIRRKQVYVEAVIMEIQPSVLQDLGVEWRGAIPLQSGDDVSQVLMGGTNYGLGANELIQGATALAGGQIPTGDTGLFPLDLGSRSGLTLGGIFDRVKVGEDPSTGNPIYLPANTLVVHALNQTTKANLLSTPHLIAMDNEEAEIVVGRNVPFITSTSQSTVSTVQSVQRENVGITLRFTPQITEGDYIQLELYQEISSLIESPVGQDPNRVGPTTSERKSTNTVLVRDGQTIIVGGLMEDRIRTNVSKVPWLRRHPRARLAVPVRERSRGKAEPSDLPHAHDYPGGPGRTEAVRREEEPDARVQGPSRPAGRDSWTFDPLKAGRARADRGTAWPRRNWKSWNLCRQRKCPMRERRQRANPRRARFSRKKTRCSTRSRSRGPRGLIRRPCPICRMNRCREEYRHDL